MSHPNALHAVILAAGQGKRMKSALPKVLHPACGVPLVHHVVRAALDAGAREAVVVVGYGRELVEGALTKAFPGRVRCATQAEPRGTGDAVAAALPHLSPEADRVLLLCGDTPLLDPDDLLDLAARASAGDHALALMTMILDDPGNYGRVLRDGAGRVVAIRERKDARGDEVGVREVNSGVYCAKVGFLRDAVGRLRPNNAQGELYLTDLVAMAANTGLVLASPARDPWSLLGVNDRVDLARAEEVLYERTADRWRKEGVTVRASARIDASVTLAADAVIEHAVVLRGATRVGEGARIDVGSVLTDVEVAPRAVVKPYSVAERASIGEGAIVGPFSHLRPDSGIGPEAHVGNFVETKKTRLARGAKANHLAYLGDGDIGEGANVGAGTIFCNYDGFKKHKTEIGAGAFIGSDSQLVAPVKIGDGAYVATGTTVTKDVPPNALAIARVRQENKEEYASRLKSKLKSRS